MSNTFYFPTHTGLLSPKHREQIGPALWEFLWLISKTTEEIEEKGEILGIVLGGRPIKINEIAEEIGGSERTVKRNLARLKEFGYLKTIRAPYGEIYSVKKSKKFKNNRNAKKGTSENKTEVPDMPGEVPDMPREVPNMPGEVPDLSKRSAENGTCNKDIKDKKHKKEEIKDKKIFINKINEIRNQFSFDINLLIDEYWNVIKKTRKSNSISYSVIFNTMQKWAKFHPLVIQYSLIKHIEGYDDGEHNEKYTLGIMRNTSPDQAEDFLNRKVAGQHKNIKKDVKQNALDQSIYDKYDFERDREPDF